eukprot:TRINITY_DN10426_c0_g1_i1.p1 TRINITY_DN10426_c0_g1~~TRINITY_DN10426_c0_g1_i1.p1  ORF type:complete len:204 (+),score=20.64 TRINITY_DN10426_c0_g1_i1:172-783(+)
MPGVYALYLSRSFPNLILFLLPLLPSLASSESGLVNDPNQKDCSRGNECGESDLPAWVIIILIAVPTLAFFILLICGLMKESPEEPQEATSSELQVVAQTDPAPRDQNQTPTVVHSSEPLAQDAVVSPPRPQIQTLPSLPSRDGMDTCYSESSLAHSNHSEVVTPVSDSSSERSLPQDDISIQSSRGFDPCPGPKVDLDHSGL